MNYQKKITHTNPTRFKSTYNLNRRGVISYLSAAATITGLSSFFSLPTLAEINNSLDHISKPRIIGKTNASIHITEYYSMTCSHCRDFHNKTFPDVKTKLIDTGKIKFELSPFPLDGLALRAHALARALPENKYFGMVTLLMSKQDEWKSAKDPLQSLYRYAQLAGISANEFNGLMQNRPLLEKIVEIRQKSSVKWQISATPSFVINNKKVISGNLSFNEFIAELAEYGI
jgi:protein-disulfide isomerase